MSQERDPRNTVVYSASACAMLLGCWLLSKALALEAGHVGGLLTLMVVLQLYEGLLVALGAFLVRSGRAPHDGMLVLAIESIFLMDATLLSAECVSASLKIGTLVAFETAVLALVKIASIRWAAPERLTRKTAGLIGTHALVILALPVIAAHLAAFRLLSPLVLYAFWWLTAALPFAQRILRRETQDPHGEAGQAYAAWTWTPAALVLVHLCSVGYIHTIDFRVAFLAPFLLGLAATADRDQVRRQLILPALGVLLCVERDAALGFHLFGQDALAISPLRLALVGVGLVWCLLAWRHRAYWLAALAMLGGLLGLLGSSALRLLGSLVRFLADSAPRDAFGWGALTIVVAFVLLAAGARRSLSSRG